MEQLLHYVWKHKMFTSGGMKTTDGRAVEVIDSGLHNTDSGPDFFNAKVKVGGTLWVGNIEIHDKSSDWFLHKHHEDKAYNNVVMHVTGLPDTEVRTEDGRCLPQLVLAVPEKVRRNYRQLLTADRYPPCHQIVSGLSSLTAHSWMSALQVERLETKTAQITRRVELCGKSWEAAYFVTLARNYGFGTNGDAFEAWAMNIPLHSVDHHRDDLFQVETLFMGQAGLLDADRLPEKYRKAAADDEYFMRMSREYAYLAHKFSLRPMDAAMWKFLRMRPNNFPHIRLSQLAQLYYDRKAGLSMLMECKTVDEARRMLATHVTPYWQTHYSFGNPSERNEKHLSAFSVSLLLVNTAVPMFFAYGRHHNDEQLCTRAFDFLEQLKPEVNYITRVWEQCGLKASNAGDSQALIQLKTQYCDRKECLRCRIGYEFLKREQ